MISRERARRLRQRIRPGSDPDDSGANANPSVGGDGPGRPAGSDWPEPDEPPDRREVDVPHGMRVAAAWSWRFLVIVAAATVIIFVLGEIRVIVIPVAVALLLTALVIPWVYRLTGIGVPRGVSAAVMLIVLLIVVFGLLTLVGQQMASEFSSLVEQAVAGIDTIRIWLVEGPLGLSDSQILEAMDAVQDAVTENREQITQGAWQVTVTVGHIVAGFLLAMFATVFFLYQGEQIWAWVVRLFPRTAQRDVDGAGRRAWRSLTAFVRATVVVAFVDAIGIMTVALVLRVPLAVPIGVLVFLMSFIPIIGAVLSGVIAILVALVAHGFWVALAMTIGVLVVQQVESHVLQPILMGRLVRLHPLAVVLAVAAGTYLLGITGALFAVPLIAVINGLAGYLTSDERRLAAAGSSGSGREGAG